MNTMKREDMEKEQQELIVAIGVNVVRVFRHIARFINAVGRVDYLSTEIEKVTPKPENKEVKDA